MHYKSLKTDKSMHEFIFVNVHSTETIHNSVECLFPAEIGLKLKVFVDDKICT